MGVSHWVETIEHARLMQEEYDFFVLGGGGGESLEYVWVFLALKSVTKVL